jgi:hypothetical protein
MKPRRTAEVPQYQVVDHFHIGPGGAEICLIERAVPGEAPICSRFKGNWAQAQVEADRLNNLAALVMQHPAIQRRR